MTNKSKIVLVDKSKTFERYYLQFANGSVGIGGIYLDEFDEGKYSIDVPGLSSIQHKKFKTKKQAILALKIHVRTH